MAESNKDDLADALKKLADGQHQSDRADQQSSSGATHWFGTTPPATSPSAPTVQNADADASDPTLPRRRSTPAGEGVTPQPVPATPRSRTPTSSNPAKPQKHATPFAEVGAAAPAPAVVPRSARPSAPPVTTPIVPAALADTAPHAPRRERPAAPSASRPMERVETPDTPAETIVEDEDDLGIGAVSADKLARRRVAAKKPPFYATLGFRQTIIPPLLTLGVALPAAGGWLMTLDPESPIRTVGAILPLTCFIAGLVLLGLGVVNVLSVKAFLKESRTK